MLTAGRRGGYCVSVDSMRAVRNEIEQVRPQGMD